MEHQRSVIGPLILITIGLLLLLANLGYLPFSLWEMAFRFWPLILIILGLDIIIGRYSRLGGLVMAGLWFALLAGIIWLSITTQTTRTLLTDTITQPLGEITRATIDLDIGFGAVTLKALDAETTDLMRGTFHHTEGVQIGKRFNVAGTEGRLTLQEERPRLFLSGMTETRWEVALHPKTPLTVRINGGVGNADLDLSALTVSALEVDAGIGSISVTAPQHGDVTMRLDGGVGNVHVTIPEGVAARIQVNRGIGMVHVNEARFPKRENVYQSTDWERATDRINVQIEGGVGIIEIR